MSQRFVAFIPARGGSKSIPLKNVRPMCGRPLIEWVLRAAAGCERIERIVVSTDSSLIAGVVLGLGIPNLEIHDRSPESASDTAGTEEVMLEYAQTRDDFDHMVFIQATSPLLTAGDLDLGLDTIATGDYDSALSVVRQKRFIWGQSGESAEPLNYDYCDRPRRQDFDGFLVENGAFYVTSRERLIETGCRLSGRIGFVEMDEASYHEIDEPSDWTVVESLLAMREAATERLAPRRSSKSDLSHIKALFTDCDGVLTDGGMYYTENGDELKKFHTRDGMGFELLRNEGLAVGIVTSESVALVERRAQKLKLDEVHTGVRDKLSVIDRICDARGLSLDEVAYVGDDINDLAVIEAVGFGCSVSDGMDVVKRAADYVTLAGGGEGAVREVAELVLAARRSR